MITGLSVVFVIRKLSGHSFNVQSVDTFGSELLYGTAHIVIR